jgi:hypothetical protein
MADIACHNKLGYSPKIRINKSVTTSFMAEIACHNKLGFSPEINY